MSKITKQVLELEIKKLNRKGLHIEYKNGYYTLYDDSVILLDGTAKEIYMFLCGLKYGLKLNGLLDDSEQSVKEKTLYEFLKDYSGGIFRLKARKYLKELCDYKENFYNIRLFKMVNDRIIFYCTVSPSNNSKSLSFTDLEVKVDTEMSINDFYTLLLRSVNVEVLKKCKSDKSISLDNLLWVSKDDMWYLNNKSTVYLCDKVEITVVKK